MRPTDAMRAAMGDAVTDGERQEAMSLLNLCYMLGIALALPVGGMVNDLAHSKGASLFLSAGLFALVAVASWRFVPSRDNHAATQETPGEFNLAGLAASIKQIGVLQPLQPLDALLGHELEDVRRVVGRQLLEDVREVGVVERPGDAPDVVPVEQRQDLDREVEGSVSTEPIFDPAGERIRA